ncbi:MAG TPA: GIY-YIG nuclease family protein [Candidatus Lokiarchaeia archaeon]|nr:GIY-YIG nuclease family protein [Candidatus Lokiarchaeia archaeon]
MEAKLSIPSTPGVYLLCMRARLSREIMVGKRGSIHVDEKAVYVYIGSALNGLRSRVGRHLDSEGKRVHWHVDYLLQVLDIFQIYYAMTNDRKECQLSMQINQQLAFFKAIGGIGNTDCRSCPSHLYRFLENNDPGTLDAVLRSVFARVGLLPVTLTLGSERQTNEPRTRRHME